MPRHEALRPQYRWWIPLTIIAAAMVLVLMILVMNREQNKDSAQDTADGQKESDVVVTEVEDPEQKDLSDFDTDEDDPLADGPVDAPVTLVVFSARTVRPGLRTLCRQCSTTSTPVICGSNGVRSTSSAAPPNGQPRQPTRPPCRTSTGSSTRSCSPAASPARPRTSPRRH